MRVLFILFLFCFSLSLSAQKSYVYIEGIRGIPFHVVLDSKELPQQGINYSLFTISEAGEKNIEITFVNTNFSKQKFTIDVQPNSSYGFRLAKTQENKFYLIDFVNEGKIIETNSATNFVLSTENNVIHFYKPELDIAKSTDESNVQVESKKKKKDLDKAENEEQQEQKRLAQIEKQKEADALNLKEQALKKEKALAIAEERKKLREEEAREEAIAKEKAKAKAEELKKAKELARAEARKQEQEEQAKEDAIALEKAKAKEETKRKAKEAKELQAKALAQAQENNRKLEDETKAREAKNKETNYGVVEILESKNTQESNKKVNEHVVQEKIETKTIKPNICIRNCSQEEMKSIVTKMIEKADDEAKLLYLKKKTVTGCFTSQQVYTIAENFDTQYGRFTAVKFLRSMTSDLENLISLDPLFRYDAYKSKLKKLVEN